MVDEVMKRKGVLSSLLKCAHVAVPVICVESDEI